LRYDLVVEDGQWKVDGAPQAHTRRRFAMN